MHFTNVLWIPGFEETASADHCCAARFSSVSLTKTIMSAVCGCVHCRKSSWLMDA